MTAASDAISFTKMQGLGNDFIVFDGLTESINVDQLPLADMADRHTGIGCDQILLLSHSERPDCDYRYRIFNADGSEVQQCGNGARCIARYLWTYHLDSEQSLLLESLAGPIRVSKAEGDQVSVDMGPPIFGAADIPVSTLNEDGSLIIMSPQGEVRLDVLSMGNPHAVHFVSRHVAENLNLSALAQSVDESQCFPEGCNVGLAVIDDRNHITLRVFERGVGETRACGSGACAAMVAARRRGRVDLQCQVCLPGGTLQIQWRDPSASVIMIGDATTVFQGRYPHD